MSKQIAIERVEGPQGAFVVSTIQTLAGGGTPSPKSRFAPFSEEDFIDETPWPYETMVFKAAHTTGTVHFATGQYHEPHATETQARDGHAFAVSHIKAGTLQIGAGVRDPFGVPSMTADEWRDRMSAANQGDSHRA